MDCYILHTELLVIFIIAIICYDYAKLTSKLKKNYHVNNIKMQNSEFKNCT